MTIEGEIKAALQELVNFPHNASPFDHQAVYQARKASETVLKHFGLTDPGKIKAEREAERAERDVRWKAEIARILADRGPLKIKLEARYRTATLGSRKVRKGRKVG